MLTTATISISKLRERLRSVVEALGKQNTVYMIQRHGKPIAVLLSVEAYHELRNKPSSSPSQGARRSRLSERMRPVWDRLEASGHRSRSAEAVDASVAEERASWEG